MRRSARLLPLACLLALSAGCGSSRSTAPPPTPAEPRLVTVVVTDSLGAFFSGGDLRATSLNDAAGFARLLTASMSDSGNVRFRLTPGPWAFTGIVATWYEFPGLALGVTVVVPGDERPSGDTVLVAAVVHTASFVRGRVRLPGRADHSGTLIALGAMDHYVLTDAEGDYTLGRLPRGNWTVTAFHSGYRLGVWPVNVPLPGSALTLAEDSLRVSDDVRRDPPARSAARPVGTPPPFTLR